MRVLTQSNNILYDLTKMYIVESYDDFNNLSIYIEGEINFTKEKVKLGNYKSKELAQEVLNMILKSDNDYFKMPNMNFEEEENFLYDNETISGSEE